MKLSYAIENIRRIRNSPEIELLPITILVGRNSAGKSTFLRSLPLIRQSIETRSSAPILWFGDLVDFGDLNVAIGESGEGKQAAFRFTIRNLIERRRRYYAHRYYSDHNREIDVSCVSIRYVIGGRGEGTILQTIEISIPDEDIKVCIDWGVKEGSSAKITINGTPPKFIPKSYKFQIASSNIFSSPSLLYRPPEKEEIFFTRRISPSTFLHNALCTVFSDHATRKLSEETITREARKILTINKKMDSSVIKNLIETSSIATFKKMYENLLSQNNNDFKNKIFAIQRLSRVFDVLDIVEDQLTDYFHNVEYLEPVRAASERFYRKQELEVSRIAPNGSNFPMFLASLSQRDLRDFSNWVEEIFEYGVSVEKTVGHISIHLTSGNRSINVTDTGYGVSQILPVLGIVWWAQHNMRSPRNRPRASNIRTLAIEQPELHLHPAHQAKLADAFVAAIAKTKKEDEVPGISLIIETHSQALINRLGELIEQGTVSADAVQIVVFSAPEDLDSPTEISVSSFDNDGKLEDWPFGFFNYSE